jgi:hypothetical protein
VIFFTEKEKKISDIHMETQKTPIINSILSKKNDTECITIPDFKLSYRVTVTKVA